MYGLHRGKEASLMVARYLLLLSLLLRNATRCGEGGIVLCCDFCHLVYHPRCLEVTPGLTSLFACSDCKEVIQRDPLPPSPLICYGVRHKCRYTVSDARYHTP